MLVKPVQPLKADPTITFTLAGMFMLVNPVQPENACSPIEVTLEGIVILVNPVQPENASLDIVVTGIPPIYSGISKLPTTFLSQPIITISRWLIESAFKTK